ncbi:ZinT family metal-binding protein [Roseovarius sp. C7]|uniref:ZinT family metal-binding protein n=1 Tax=Roseovarius sp. C7 TaxID=3398643 RepID=UPI0039F65CE3
MTPLLSRITLIALAASLALPALAGSKSDSHSHDHSHDHAHDHASDAEAKAIYDGYFDDADIAPRPLSDWAGIWQSVYPYLQDGTLDPVMARKAETGDKTAAEYRAYYDTGYATDVDRITIAGDTVTFETASTRRSGTYTSDGYEILTYAKGNRGVRYIFAKTDGDAQAPDFIQFSDHRIAPEPSDHYHLYWGTDRAALLDEVTNWPTYYPARLSGTEIVAEMLAH